MAAQLTFTKGASRARAALVDGPGHELLAGAALALDEHRGVGAPPPGDAGELLLHGRAVADHPVDLSGRVADDLAQVLRLVAQQADLRPRISDARRCCAG